MCFCLCIEVAEDRQTEIKLPNISDVFTVDERLRQERKRGSHLNITSAVEWWVAIQELKQDRADTPHVHLRTTKVQIFFFERLEVQISHVGVSTNVTHTVIPCHRTFETASLLGPCTNKSHKLCLHTPQDEEPCRSKRKDSLTYI